ncbi:hypothetical protein BKA62DRAFT_689245 [Auriculariales sp. MPI-PUGE-AT-0066]|nr:hypothetical protein BKA62DRAFT_689245 [Auriculariales sp. MPI-PUGE-AT-0066]
MPNLTKLSINGDGSGGTNKMLEAIAQQLIDLCILEDVSDPPKQPVLFPQLRSLTLDDASYLNHIRAPTLQTLTLNTAHYYNISCLEPFESVLHLCLYGRVWGELAYLLQQLPNIVHLTFEVIAHSKRTWPGADKYIIERGFFEALRLSSSDSLPAWRRLEYIRFGHSGCIGAGAILEPQELIDFVVHRNVVHEHFEDTGETVKLRPARIHTVTVDFEGASELLISELNMKLSTT